MVNTQNLTYTFSQRSKRNLMIVAGLGILLMIIGIIFGMMHKCPEADLDHRASFGQRVWANFLVNSFFFGSIALAATFFYAMQYAAQAAWSVAFQRIFSAITTFLPIGLGLLLLILLCGSAGLHHLYHWQDKKAVAEDPLLQHKMAYFSPLFYYGRIIIFFIGWTLYQRWARMRTLEEDMVGGTGIYRRSITKAAIFLVFFGFTSSVFSWDVLMSLDVHWYSTLFGWYVFAGMWISFLIFAIMVTLHLKSRGQVEFINESHIHDMGKWMFAVSFLWTYLWFAQFMLIWYSNIPEEVVYYMQRWEQYRGLFWMTMLVNFSFPMIMLMSRDAKRNKNFLLFVGSLIFIFHWCDVFLMVMPATVGRFWGISWMEVGMFLTFLGIFIYWVMNALSKAPLFSKNHPFVGETLRHHI